MSLFCIRFTNLLEFSLSPKDTLIWWWWWWWGREIIHDKAFYIQLNLCSAGDVPGVSFNKPVGETIVCFGYLGHN